MRILIVTPSPSELHGNRITALRYRDILSRLGHTVLISGAYDGQRCDLLVGLHARKSYESIARFRQEHPSAPIVLILTGTDVYEDLPDNELARKSLDLADRVVALQPLAVRQLPDHIVPKFCAIIQSAIAAPNHRPPAGSVFRVCVLSNLRRVKDPLRAAQASRLLPPDSRTKIIHIGSALEPGLEEAARIEMATNPRYSWKGERSHRDSMMLLAGSRLMVQSSLLEGGANAVSEALANDVPIVCSAIPGNLGILGEDYPGSFEPGNTQELAEMMYRGEKDAEFYGLLKEHCRLLQPLIAPEREAAAWNRLLKELNG